MKTGILIVGTAVLIAGCAHDRSREEVASSLVSVARELIQKGDTKQAQTILDNAKRLDPQSPDMAALAAPSGANPSPVPPTPAPASSRVSLPYAYMRHGVTIRVTSVEFSPDSASLLVNATLQEIRGRHVELSSNLMEARISGGEALPYLHYARSGNVSQDTEIAVAPNEQVQIALFFQLPSLKLTNLGASVPIELRFPTGRFWASDSAD